MTDLLYDSKSAFGVRPRVGVQNTNSIPSNFPVSLSAVSIHNRTSIVPVPSSILHDAFVALLTIFVILPTNVTWISEMFHVNYDQRGDGKES